MSKLFYGLSGFLVLFALLFFFRSTPIARQVAVRVPSALPIEEKQIKTVNVFQFSLWHEPSDEADLTHFQLDARDSWRRVGSFTGPGYVIFKTTGLACSPPDPCTGPNGQAHLAKLTPPDHHPEMFPIAEAMCNGLGGKWDNGSGFQIGEENRIPIPQGTHDLYLTDNIKEKYRAWATGGHSGTFAIHGE